MIGNPEVAEFQREPHEMSDADRVSQRQALPGLQLTNLERGPSRPQRQPGKCKDG